MKLSRLNVLSGSYQFYIATLFDSLDHLEVRNGAHVRDPKFKKKKNNFYSSRKFPGNCPQPRCHLHTIRAFEFHMYLPAFSIPKHEATLELLPPHLISSKQDYHERL